MTGRRPDCLGQDHNPSYTDADSWWQELDSLAGKVHVATRTVLDTHPAAEIR